MPDPAAFYPPAAQADRRPSVMPYLVQRSPELLRAADDAFRAFRELERYATKYANSQGARPRVNP